MANSKSKHRGFPLIPLRLPVSLSASRPNPSPSSCVVYAPHLCPLCRGQRNSTTSALLDDFRQRVAAVQTHSLTGSTCSSSRYGSDKKDDGGHPANSSHPGYALYAPAQNRRLDSTWSKDVVSTEDSACRSIVASRIQRGIPLSRSLPRRVPAVHLDVVLC